MNLRHYAPLSSGIVFLLFLGLTIQAVPLRIMPLGDSETYGWERKPPLYTTGYSYTCSVGYRYWLWKLFQDSSIAVDFVGPLNNGSDRFPSSGFDTDHAGFSGIGLRQMYARLNDYAGRGPLLTQYPADIILLHIGTNDVRSYDSLADPDHGHDNFYHPDEYGYIRSIMEYLYIKERSGRYRFTASNGGPVNLYIALIIGYQIRQASTALNIINLNDRIRMEYDDFILNHREESRYIHLVDIHDSVGLNYFCRLETSRKYDNDTLCPWDSSGDFANDALHPIESGYKKFALGWFRAFIASRDASPVYVVKVDGDTPPGSHRLRIERLRNNSSYDEIRFYDIRGRALPRTSGTSRNATSIRIATLATPAGSQSMVLLPSP